jgi:hypothetical protein
LQSRIRGWLRDAYLDIAYGFNFEELEDTSDDVTVKGSDTYDYPSTARAIRCLSILDSNGSPKELDQKNINYVRRIAAKEGKPSIYAPFKRTVILRSVPDKAYTLRWDFYVKPTIETNIETTDLLVPDDWLVIIDNLAAAYGFMALKERDKAKEQMLLLYGDPKNPHSPGLIKAKLNRRAQEAPARNYGIGPRVRSYTGV